MTALAVDVRHAPWCNAHFPDGEMPEDVGFCCYEARVAEVIVNIDPDGLRLYTEDADQTLTPDQARQVAAQLVQVANRWEASR